MPSLPIKINMSLDLVFEHTSSRKCSSPGNIVTLKIEQYFQAGFGDAFPSFPVQAFRHLFGVAGCDVDVARCEPWCWNIYLHWAMFRYM
jgi:hypothetical protein